MTRAAAPPDGKASSPPAGAESEKSSAPQDQGQADLTCQFCDKIYHYSKEQLEELLAEM